MTSLLKAMSLLDHRVQWRLCLTGTNLHRMSLRNTGHFLDLPYLLPSSFSLYLLLLLLLLLLGSVHCFEIVPQVGQKKGIGKIERERGFMSWEGFEPTPSPLHHPRSQIYN